MGPASKNKVSEVPESDCFQKFRSNNCTIENPSTNLCKDLLNCIREPNKMEVIEASRRIDSIEEFL